MDPEQRYAEALGLVWPLSAVGKKRVLTVIAAAEEDCAQRLREQRENAREDAEYAWTRAREAEAEVERLTAIVNAAALETYTPDGSERFVAAFHQTLGRAEAAEAEVKRLRLAKGPALFDEMVTAMLARAESAEGERDAALAVLAQVEPILALLHYRGIVDSAANRGDRSSLAVFYRWAHAHSHLDVKTALHEVRAALGVDRG